MAIRKIQHVSFSYRIPIQDPARPDGDPIYSEMKAPRGAEVDIPLEEDLARGEKFGAFYPVEEEGESSEGKKTDDEVPVSEMSDDELVAWIKEDKPTVPETVEAAEGDPDNARRLLDAEDKATGGNSRQGVVAGLTAVVQQAQ